MGLLNVLKSNDASAKPLTYLNHGTYDDYTTANLGRRRPGACDCHQAGGEASG